MFIVHGSAHPLQNNKHGYSFIYEQKRKKHCEKQKKTKGFPFLENRNKRFRFSKYVMANKTSILVQLCLNNLSFEGLF